MAIKGFEALTHEIREGEEALVPIIVEKVSSCIGKQNAITNAQLRSFILDKTGKNIHGGRFRKIVEFIRNSQPETKLIASVSGYFIAATPEEFKEWLDTMKQRRNAISFTIGTGEKILRSWVGYKQPNQHKRPKLDISIQQPNIFQLNIQENEN